MFLIYILSSIFLLIGIFILESKKIFSFKKTTYYKITNNNYYQTLLSKETRQEYYIYDYLKDIEKFEGKFLFNLYIPKNKDDWTKIDGVLICKKGIFVLESKNYQGLIVGNEKYKYWTQITIKNGEEKKDPLYNPIYQNENHIYYLSYLLKQSFKMFSLVIFSDNCKLSNILVSKPNIYLLKMHDLTSKFCEIYNNNPDVFTTEQINKIYDYLYPYTKVSNSLKEKHHKKVKQIQEKKFTHTIKEWL